MPGRAAPIIASKKRTSASIKGQRLHINRLLGSWAVPVTNLGLGDRVLSLRHIVVQSLQANVGIRHIHYFIWQLALMYALTVLCDGRAAQRSPLFHSAMSRGPRLSIQFLFILLSLFFLRQVHSLFQSEFSTECYLMLPLSKSIILSSCESHPALAYIFFPLVSCLLFSP